jgi:hypothetical protein
MFYQQILDNQGLYSQTVFALSIPLLFGFWRLLLRRWEAQRHVSILGVVKDLINS